MGTSCRTKKLVGDLEDHPHACGDKNRRECAFLDRQGSSPRVWGQVRGGFTHAQTARIIPTRVGTSFALRCTTVIGRDHPHACGDKLWDISHRATAHGSSPRVWGQGQMLGNLTTNIGIIPTRVGTSVLIKDISDLG